jgi:hypothetical protein
MVLRRARWVLNTPLMYTTASLLSSARPESSTSTSVSSTPKRRREVTCVLYPPADSGYQSHQELLIAPYRPPDTRAPA